MPRGVLLATLCALSAVCAALGAATSAQSKPGDTPPAKDKPTEETPAKDKPVNEVPAKDKPVVEVKPAEAAYEMPEDYKGLMKKISASWRKAKKAVTNKTADQLKDEADKVRFYAGKILDKETEAKRKEAKDYTGWAADLEKEARALRDLAAGETKDWAAIGKQKDTVTGVCESCHKIYDPEEDK